MREIKFRLFDSEEKRMIYPTLHHNQDYVLQLNCSYIGEFNRTTYDTVKMILMQYVGLKDKNGKEIYEGDILRLSDGGDVSHHRIYWDEKAARWMDTRLEDGDSLTCYDDFTFVTECKIIGNIYENPNLLQ